MNIEQLRTTALDGKAYELASDNMGIYPKSTTTKGVETLRTEWQEGWNAAAMSLNDMAGKAMALIRNLPLEVQDLVLQEKLSVNLRKDEEPSLYLRCNDVYFWGCADAKDITVEEIPSLLAAFQESPQCGDILWISRKRKERPQGAFFSYIPEAEWPMFFAAGPERETGLGNPYAPGEYK